MDATAVLSPGDRLGEYVVERQVRDRDRVTVYSGSDPSVGRNVALYVSKDQTGTRAAESFLEYTRQLAGIEHPALQPIYAVGTDGTIAFAAARLSGTPADLHHREGPLSEPAAVAVVEGIAGAVEVLHGAGISSVPDAAQVLVEGDRARPAAVLAPLESRPSSRDPSAEVAALLATLTGGGGAAVSSARAAAASSSPAQVAAAARAALRPVRRSRRLAAVALVLVALGGAAAAAIALLRADGGDDGERAAPAVPARISATIPVGSEPISMAATGGSLWVTATDGRLLRVDMRTNRVVGAPRRLQRNARGALFSVFEGGGALYAVSGDAKLLLRLDPASGRIIERRRFSTASPLAGEVVDDTLWLARQPFEDDPSGQPDVVPLDARTLADAGRPIAVGQLPAALVADGSALLVVGQQDGTLTRVDTRTRRARRVLVGPKPGVPALLHGRVWVPDGATGVVSGLAANLSEPPASVLPVGLTPAVASVHETLWALQVDPNGGPRAPARLVRLDARNGGMASAPVPLGRGAEFMAVTDDDLWISSIGRKALLRVAPARDARADRRLAVRGSGELASGPSRPGRRSTEISGLEASIDGGAGWVVTAVPELLDLRRFDSPYVGLAVMVPELVYGARGSTGRATSAGMVLARLRANPDLRVDRPRSIRIGDRRARTVMVSVRASARRNEYCPGQCAPLVGRERVTLLVSAPARGRVTVLDVHGRAVVILEDTPDGESLALTGPLMGTLRFP